MPPKDTSKKVADAARNLAIVFRANRFEFNSSRSTTPVR